MFPMTEIQLAELIPLKGPIPPASEDSLKPSLELLYHMASVNLCFEAHEDMEGGSILIRHKGHLDYHKDKVVKDGVETLAEEVETIKCTSMVSLRQAVRHLRDLRMEGTFPGQFVKDKVEQTESWEVASAIVMVLTIQNKLRVCGKYVRWCKPANRRPGAFKVDMPMCIKAGTDVDVESAIWNVGSDEHRTPRLQVRVDDSIMLCLFKPLLEQEAGQDIQMICGMEVKQCHSDNKAIEGFKSEWNICYSTAPAPPNYFASKVPFYLH